MTKKKKMPTIKPMTVELTAQEVLALRHIHSHWANSHGNSPFCDAMSDQFLEKLGGYLEDCDSLWDHPLGQKWYDANDYCSGCGRHFKNEELKKFPSDPVESDDLYCDECIKDMAS